MEDQAEIQKGNQFITRQELDSIPLPTETETFKPVNHSQIADIIIRVASNILAGYRLDKEEFW